MNIDVEFHIRHNYLWARLPASVKQVAPCGRPHLLAAGSGVWGEVAARPCPARPCPALPTPRVGGRPRPTGGEGNVGLCWRIWVHNVERAGCSGGWGRVSVERGT